MSWGGQKVLVDSVPAGVTGSYESHDVSAENQLGSSPKQHMLLTAEPSLKPLLFLTYLNYIMFILPIVYL